MTIKGKAPKEKVWGNIKIMKSNKLISSLILSGIVALTSSAIAEDTTYLEELGAKLKAAVKAGEITREEAMAKYKAAETGEISDTATSINGFFVGSGKDNDGQPKATIIVPGKTKDKSKWPTITFIGESVVTRFSDLNNGAVVVNIDDGQSKKAVSGKKGAKGKGKLVMRKGGGKGGSVNFYSIVIGRLKSKDIELGEFTMQVDYATLNRYSAARIKDEIIGKTIKVTGVSGQFRDNLLLIKTGQTLKVRTSGYSSDSKTLAFAHKFNVLERALPFSPDAHGVPPETFRGFRGVLRGKIVEVAGYEVLLRAEEITSLDDASIASDANSIKGKLVRINGFYNDHADKFNELQLSDVIQVSVRHANPIFDTFGVTDVLEIVEQ
ncbi:MAG: hypothetical protein H8E20_00930 [Verrucomicrobia bacterium]|nr:hypothetical protein [Verrucomicrobiota bacterium]